MEFVYIQIAGGRMECVYMHCVSFHSCVYSIVAVLSFTPYRLRGLSGGV